MAYWVNGNQVIKDVPDHFTQGYTTEVLADCLNEHEAQKICNELNQLENQADLRILTPGFRFSVEFTKLAEFTEEIVEKRRIRR